MKKFDQRRRFILNYLRGEYEPGSGLISHVDVLSSRFVDEYIKATEAKFGMVPYGAFLCPALGRDLTRMYREGSLVRKRTGIQGMAGQGFPRWVWTYQLAPHVLTPAHDRDDKEKGYKRF